MLKMHSVFPLEGSLYFLCDLGTHCSGLLQQAPELSSWLPVLPNGLNFEASTEILKPREGI